MPVGAPHAVGATASPAPARADEAAPSDDLPYWLTAAAAQSVQPELHLRPDKASKYEVAAGVMASAQRLGLTRIGIVGSEQFVE